mgnify:CR=1 FL=1
MKKRLAAFVGRASDRLGRSSGVFFAVLIARELPGRRRVWPYLLAGVATALVAFARLYLGAHWLSDVRAGVLLGVGWLLVLGVAYRVHSPASLWMLPLAWTFARGCGGGAVGGGVWGGREGNRG